MLQRPGPPDRDVGVELRADPGDLTPADPDAAHRDHQGINPAGADALDVSLHHHGVQRHVDAPAGSQRCREERAGADLRDLHREVASGGRDELVAGAVAVGRALMQLRADTGGRLRIDDGLKHPSEQPAHELTAVGGAEHLDHLEQGRII